jgi:hypothetical protein
LKILFLAAQILALPAFVSAHDIPRSESRVEVRGREARVVLKLNLLEMRGVDTDGDGAISYDELENAIDRIYAEVKTHYVLLSPDPPVQVTLKHYGISEDHVLDLEMSYIFPRDVTQLQIVSTLYQITQPGDQHLLTVNFNGELHEAILDAEHQAATFNAGVTSSRKTAASFMKLGIEHIFTGYDHLAFLVGLLIVTTSLGSMIKVITSFTVAHSITLALATFDLVIIPARITESLIALSIGYVAAENLLGIRAIERYRITFLFGLVHGFGFSNVLREMQLSRSHLALSLFSFNAGVEVGQIIFVLVTFPLIVYLARTHWQQQIKVAVSLTVMCLAVYWFVQRAFLL